MQKFQNTRNLNNDICQTFMTQNTRAQHRFGCFGAGQRPLPSAAGTICCLTESYLVDRRPRSLACNGVRSDQHDGIFELNNLRRAELDARSFKQLFFWVLRNFELPICTPKNAFTRRKNIARLLGGCSSPKPYRCFLVVGTARFCIWYFTFYFKIKKFTNDLHWASWAESKKVFNLSRAKKQWTYTQQECNTVTINRAFLLLYFGEYSTQKPDGLPFLRNVNFTNSFPEDKRQRPKEESGSRTWYWLPIRSQRWLLELIPSGGWGSLAFGMTLSGALNSSSGAWPPAEGSWGAWPGALWEGGLGGWVGPWC